MKTIRWNTNKEGGWKSYYDLASDSANLWKIAKDTCEDPEVLFKDMEKELKTIKYKAFGKVKVKSTKKEMKEIDILQTKKNLHFMIRNMLTMKTTSKMLSRVLMRKYMLHC